MNKLTNAQKLAQFTKRSQAWPSQLKYCDRLKIVGLVSADIRRMHTDSITMYKLLQNKSDCNLHVYQKMYVEIVFFTLNSALKTNGYVYKLINASFRIVC